MTALRRITESDAADDRLIGDIVRVWRDARRDYLQFLSNLHDAEEDCGYVRGLVRSHHLVWAAEVDGKIAGFVAFGEGWVSQLYVASWFQSRGIGTELLDLAKQASPSLQLWAFEVNVPAIRFYEHRGFRIVERTDGAGNEAKQPDVRMRWDDAGIDV